MGKHESLECDYFVIGAGATGMASVDTVLMHSKHTKLTIVDKADEPGGHWLKYPKQRTSPLQEGAIRSGKTQPPYNAETGSGSYS